MTRNKPTLEYGTPQPRRNFWRTPRGERVHLILSFATIVAIAGLIFAGCYFI